MVFILRENKTFDEELGTYKKAGKWADKNLALFSKKQLPNLFYDLREGTLFANFMVDGEVTAQGHQWTTGANVSDFVEKTWQEYYTSRGLAENPGWTESLLPGEATGWGGIPRSKEDPYAIYKNLKTLGKWSNPWISYPYRLYLFDELLRKNISFEDFGEFVSRNKLGNISEKMKKHLAIDYPGWDRMILDTYRAKYVINWLKIHKDSFPRFIYIWLPDDHTAGLNSCYYTPAYYVANNDYATQMIISYLSKTPQWKNMVIFITEDDAQSGEDHIDAHRTFAVAISPWVKRDYISTKPYSQVNIIRTIEAILNIKPLSQWDQTSFIFNDIWTDKPSYKPLKLLQIKEPIKFNPGKCDDYTLLRRYLGAKGLLPNSYWIKWFKKHKNELINKNGFFYKPNKKNLYTPTSLLKVPSQEQLKQEWIATKGIESYENLKEYTKNMKK